MYYEAINHGAYISVTGGYELSRTWFPYSRVYHSPDTGMSLRERASNDLMSFLVENDYLEIALDEKKQTAVKQFVHDLAAKYGQKELGFGRKIPDTLKPMLKYFGLEVIVTSKHKNSDQIIQRPHSLEEE